MGPLGHIHFNDSGIHRDAHIPNTPRIPNNTRIPSPPMSATTGTSSTTSADSAHANYPAHIVTANGQHASAWSVTCKPIARRPLNPYLPP
ncbi:unnamed protein product [Schistocephalus solidus]|uniref:Uncharacterized protein n=1 Tax=Schistocephalus solidus TaxID=70667 RepID=A0A183THU3_SCHSO|nr:unnamed protein product [Schistocephalus solidus]